MTRCQSAWSIFPQFRVGPGDAGVVHEDIDLASERGGGCRSHGFDRTAIGQIDWPPARTVSGVPISAAVAASAAESRS